MTDDLDRLELEAEVARLRLENARLRAEVVMPAAAPHVVGPPRVWTLPPRVATGSVAHRTRLVSRALDCVDDPDAMPTFWTVGRHDHLADGALRGFGEGCTACDTYWRRSATWQAPAPTAEQLREDAEVKRGAMLADPATIEPDLAPEPVIDPGRRPGFRSYED